MTLTAAVRKRETFVTRTLRVVAPPIWGLMVTARALKQLFGLADRDADKRAADFDLTSEQNS